MLDFGFHAEQLDESLHGMNCPRCRTEAPAAAALCGSCGTPFPARPPFEDEDGGVTLLPPRSPSGDAGGRFAASVSLPAPGLEFGSGEMTGVPGTVPGSAIAGAEAGPLKPGQSFGPRYHIVKLIGLGGMGAVYQAWDSELGVLVALKVIRPEAAADPAAARDLERRFKRELLLARQVTHRNVVRIHDLGELGGIKYITMPFVQGEDLATLLDREGRLAVPRTLAIARGILSGLVAAHEAGVVHRDLKPANVMIGEHDEALIMDFGIARSTGDTGIRSKATALPARSEGVTAGATSAGEIVGTVEYMAPEQVRGDPADQRADIYAFGLILYDMLLGRRRHQRAESAIAELRARLEAPPPAPRSVDETVPDSLDRIVSRCIAPALGARYQTTQELLAELDRLDAQGRPLPTQRRIIHAVVAGALVLVVAMFALNWWLVRSRAPEAVHAPVTVLISDFSNSTGDPAFDRTLEPMLRLGLEGATFISAYDRGRMRTAFGVTPPQKLDEAAARQVAMKQSVDVVLAGSIVRSGGGYEISIKATQPISGNATATTNARAATKEQVLETVTKLAAKVRKALGEKTAEADQLFAMRNISRGSLDAISQYAAGIQLQSQGKYEEAIPRFRKAVELDPNFVPGYNSLAVNLKNVGKVEESAGYAKEALRHLGGMTERERLSTRGNYYRLTGDLQQCVKEYGQLTARYPADTVARNNRAFCLARLRDYRQAVNEMRQALKILPNHMTYRLNVALWSAYAGDFAAAEREVAAIPNATADAMQPLPLSLLAQGRLQEAAAAYGKMATMGTFGGSFAASGLGDLAVYEGRYSDAVAIYERGVEADVKADNPDFAAEKLAALAHAQLSRGRIRAAVAAAERALANGKALSVRFLGARILVEAGATAKAQRIAASLAGDINAEPQAYGKIVEGEIALKQRNLPQAIKTLSDANAVLDTWIGHFDLGRAYLEAGAFAQADSEFDRCLTRRGEALMLVDEDPTYGYFPPVYYYLGRAREGLQSAGYLDLYREYLKIRGQSADDPLAADVRRRTGL
jgi:serine/threonine protein kinase/Flp pilus assembly protein TadD